MLEYLKSRLSSTMKKNHENKFKTPEGYFKSFNERLMDKIAKEDSIIPENDGFSVPDGYFEEVPKKVLTKIAPKVISLNNYRKYYFAAAAIAALFVLAFIFKQENEPEFGFNDLASAELDAYFLDANSDFTSDDLFEALVIEDLTIMDITETDDSFEKELILDYLDENVDEIEDLNLDYEEFN